MNFPTGALEPVAVTVDEEGSLYIADFGRDQRNAQIMKFEPVTLGASTDAAGIAPAPEAGLDSEAPLEGAEDEGAFTEEAPLEDEGAFTEEAPLEDEGEFLEELPTFE